MIHTKRQPFTGFSAEFGNHDHRWREQTGVRWHCTCGAFGVRNTQAEASESARLHRTDCPAL